MKIELSDLVKQLLYKLLPNSIIFRLRFFWKHGYWPNLKKPRSLTEKLLWLMVWDKNPLRAKVVDRIKAREFVQEHAPTCKSPKHLWVGESLTLEIWNNLPQIFVLKANHGSHMTYFVDKSNDSFDAIASLSKTWVNKDYSLDFGEWVYHDLPRLLIAEEKLDIKGKIPADWKFYCTNGEVLYVSLIMDRGQSAACENFYLSDFSRLNNLSSAVFPSGPDIDEPVCFKNAVRIAKQLSKPFDFIRVDLYLVGESVYFGEMTCYPGAALVTFKPKNYDFEFGSRIALDKSFISENPRPVWKNYIKSA